MLILYKFYPKSAEWCAFRDEMLREGHTPVTRYERVTPSDPSIVYPMGDHYLTDRGEKCWPWVIFAGSPTRGYILHGVAPLPIPVTRDKSRRQITRAERKKKKSSKSEQAANYFIRQAGKVTRQEAASRYRISIAALSSVLSARSNVPSGRNNSRSARAVRWLAENPKYTRYDAARLFGINYRTICKTLNRHGISKPANAGFDLTDEQIAELKRSITL